MIPTEQTKYILVIDTEQYTGNFERQLCAYCTGVAGDCEVGEEEADIFRQECPNAVDLFIDDLEFRPDDSDSACSRPCAICTTPGWCNNGMGGQFRDDETYDAIALAHFIEVGVTNEREQIDRLERARGMSESKRTSRGWSHAELEERVAERRKTIAALRAKTTVSKYPAYLSVAIFFYNKPTPKQLSVVKLRAEKFVDYKKNEVEDFKRANITITGFRLIEEKTTFTQWAV